MILPLALLLGLTLVVAGAHAETRVQYTLDPAQSEFVVQLFKAGVGAAFAHDHVARATAYTGQIQVDPANPLTAVIAVEVQAASLQMDEPAVRRQYGLTPLSEEERLEIQATMESETQLHVAQYPTIKFRSTRIESQTEGQYLITGELTLRGVTQSVTFPVQVEQRKDQVHGWGTLRFKQSSFGYKPYSAFLGAVKNRDEVVLHFHVVATPQTE